MAFSCGHKGNVGFVYVQEGMGMFLCVHKSEKGSQINIMYVRDHKHL